MLLAGFGAINVIAAKFHVLFPVHRHRVRTGYKVLIIGERDKKIFLVDMAIDDIGINHVLIFMLMHAKYGNLHVKFWYGIRKFIQENPMRRQANAYDLVSYNGYFYPRVAV